MTYCEVEQKMSQSFFGISQKLLIRLAYNFFLRNKEVYKFFSGDFGGRGFCLTMIFCLICEILMSWNTRFYPNWGQKIVFRGGFSLFWTNMQDSVLITQKTCFAFFFFTLIPLKMADLAFKSLKHFSHFEAVFSCIFSKKC